MKAAPTLALPEQGLRVLVLGEGPGHHAQCPGTTFTADTLLVLVPMVIHLELKSSHMGSMEGAESERADAPEMLCTWRW